MLRTLLLTLALLAGLARAAEPAAEPAGYADREAVQRFADEAAVRHGLDAAQVRAVLAQARYQPRVAQLIMPPPVGTAKDWAAYRKRFIEPVRLRAGAAFWRANAAWLQRAQERYGVPPQVIVGIVGVETLYGRHMGGFRIVDVLATLAFDFPSGRRDRSGFFRDELMQFLLMCRTEGLDPLLPKGSYAGAIGMPQFMPSSINRYAIDFDGNGHVDLQGSAADVIGSIANYLAEFGWTPGMPTHYPVAPPADPADRALLLGPDILPAFTAAEFAQHGAQLFGSGTQHPGLLALVELQNGEAPPSHVAGTANFYALTRYNWSSYYAMAVIDLGDAVQRAVAAD